jgi:DNA-binding transcriptional LysR family regulator
MPSPWTSSVRCARLWRSSIKVVFRRPRAAFKCPCRWLFAPWQRWREGWAFVCSTGRRLHLTEAGAEFHQRCKRIVAEVEEAEQAVSEQRRTPTGTLAINAPVLFGRMHVAPLLGAFLERHPRLVVELTLSDRNVDLIEEGVDVAVRIGHLPDSSLAATRLGSTQRVLVASPDYLRQAGTPTALKDLSDHNCLRFTGLTPGRHWHFVGDGGEIGIPVSGSFASNSGDAVIEMALQGRGIACVLYYQVMDAIAAGRLHLLLQEFAPAPLPIHAVFAHPRLVLAKVRAFVDHLKHRFDERSFLPVERERPVWAPAGKTARPP